MQVHWKIHCWRQNTLKPEATVLHQQKGCCRRQVRENSLDIKKKLGCKNIEKILLDKLRFLLQLLNAILDIWHKSHTFDCGRDEKIFVKYFLRIYRDISYLIKGRLDTCYILCLDSWPHIFTPLVAINKNHKIKK